MNFMTRNAQNVAALKVAVGKGVYFSSKHRNPEVSKLTLFIKIPIVLNN